MSACSSHSRKTKITVFIWCQLCTRNCVASERCVTSICARCTRTPITMSITTHSELDTPASDGRTTQCERSSVIRTWKMTYTLLYLITSSALEAIIYLIDNEKCIRSTNRVVRVPPYRHLRAFVEDKCRHPVHCGNDRLVLNAQESNFYTKHNRNHSCSHLHQWLDGKYRYTIQGLDKFNPLFTSKIFQAICEQLYIKALTSTEYLPRQEDKLNGLKPRSFHDWAIMLRNINKTVTAT